ncbi:LysR substrate-binding domain-containing protein [Parachitinimonas caeni]|uniref:LysR substrate-binding domain-containing protein n=1 Tax=Parachitinimonas caeni TaxID=3031301 RepID=A0ABT7E4D8_9NEIS|nr:LysR substrate-binding domain-containing protein [Parachitinimonas caeni]MDK2125772.1 LysR substrate-binding domain-containing protein [Parachitinimonas caeni]
MKKRYLPSLHALRAFEAAARHLSFSQAAEELHVSQSAISHHIRQLEEELGQALFVRLTRALALTPAGEAMLPLARQGFDLLAEAARKARECERAQVRVSVLPSFAAYWLVPRLSRFQAAYPQIEIILEPALDMATVGAGGVDLAIRYGYGDWPGGRCQKLIDETLTPVCLPNDLPRLQQAPAGSRLGEFTLLATKPLPRNEWLQWAAVAGVDLSSARFLMLTDYNIVLQAVRQGQGLALGRRSLLGLVLQQGELVEPYPQWCLRGEVGYWLVLPESPPALAVLTFCDWLQSEALA